MSTNLESILQEGRVTYTPLSVRQALRLGTVSNDEARRQLESWGESEEEIQAALDSRGWK